jgi:hypothetical protein
MKCEPFTLGFVYAQVFVYALALAYAQVLGVYDYAAVPRAGLWPATPP